MEADISREAVKTWLKDLRVTTGYSQETLAALIQTDVKTVKNAEKPRASLPQGINMVRYLAALGAVVDAPLNVPGADRLEELAVQVAQLATKADLEAGLETLRVAIQSAATQGSPPKSARRSGNDH